MAELLEKLKDELNLSPDLEEKLSSMINNFQSLDNTEKAEFLRNARESLRESITAYTGGMSAINFWRYTQSYGLLLTAVILITFVLVFFGYKLYKSLVEREQKREMKRLQRQMKKKK